MKGLDDSLHYERAPWAVLPEKLVAIAHAMWNRGISAEEITPEARAQAVAADGGGESKGGIAVIPLHGLITPRPSLLSMLMGGGGGLESFKANLREAIASKDVASILIDVDSPGGSTSGLTETAAEIRAARDVKPVTAIANGTAASAAYWLGSQASEFVVSPSGSVGSIGVFAAHEDISAMAEKEGVKVTLVSAGKYKVEGNPYEPLSDEARAAAQEMVDDHYGQFAGDVAAGRNVPVESVTSGFGEGRMVTAEKAVGLGMVDRVATYEQTLQAMATAITEAAPPVTAHTPVPAPQATSEVPEDQPGSKPDPKERSEEEKARTERLIAMQLESVLGRREAVSNANPNT